MFFIIDSDVFFEWRFLRTLIENVERQLFGPSCLFDNTGSSRMCTMASEENLGEMD